MAWGKVDFWCGVTVLVALLPGCFLRPPPAEVNRLPVAEPLPETNSAEPGRYEISTHLLDLPAGATEAYTRLWADTIDPLPHANSAILAANGLRVGVLTYPGPAELQRLMQTETSLSEARLRTTAAGTAKLIPLNTPREQWSVNLLRDLAGRPAMERYDRAECALEITIDEPTGAIPQMTLTPTLQHGEKRRFWSSTADGTAMQTEDRRSREQLASLVVALPVDENALLLIGGTGGANASLGEGFFTSPDGTRQRLLVVQIKPIAASATRPQTTDGGRGIAALVR